MPTMNPSIPHPPNPSNSTSHDFLQIPSTLSDPSQDHINCHYYSGDPSRADMVPPDPSYIPPILTSTGTGIIPMLTARRPWEDDYRNQYRTFSVPHHTDYETALPRSEPDDVNHLATLNPALHQSAPPLNTFPLHAPLPADHLFPTLTTPSEPSAGPLYRHRQSHIDPVVLPAKRAGKKDKARSRDDKQVSGVGIQVDTSKGECEVEPQGQKGESANPIQNNLVEGQIPAKSPIRWVKNGRVTFNKFEHGRTSEDEGAMEQLVSPKPGNDSPQTEQAMEGGESSKMKVEVVPDVGVPAKRIGKGKGVVKAAKSALKSGSRLGSVHEQAEKDLEKATDKDEENVVEGEKSLAKSDRVRFAEAVKASEKSLQWEDDDDDGVDYSGWAREKLHK